MSRTKIPAKEIITCDLCARDISNGEGASAQGKISLKCHGLDYQGSAVGPGDDLQYEFCNKCYDRMRFDFRNLLAKGGPEADG